MQYSASSFSSQYPLFSYRTPSSCLRLLPRLPVPSLLSSIFPSTTSIRRQFLCQMWPIKLAFLLFIMCRLFTYSLAFCNTSFFAWSILMILSILPSQHHISKISLVFLVYIPKCPSFKPIQSSAPNVALQQFCPQYIRKKMSSAEKF